MCQLVLALLHYVGAFFHARHNLGLESLALRQQLIVLKHKRPRPRLAHLDRLFWVVLRRHWPHWSEALLIVKPETVVGWHRKGFRLYWRLKSRAHSIGRAESWMRRSVVSFGGCRKENSIWGAPRIHGELLKLGFEVSERSVSRYLARWRPRGNAAEQWMAFLRNHREAIVAMDFFTVPTATFRLLYCLFVIEHGRRTILHCNVTRHPTSQWVVQQLREALPDFCRYRHMILDRDTKLNDEVIDFLKSTGLKPVRTSIRSPWQNGIAERWVGSCRRELLDHVIAFNEAHLRRMVRNYISYYHEDRTHHGLLKETPGKRPVERRPSEHARLVALPRAGGLHHRYRWDAAA